MASRVEITGEQRRAIAVMDKISLALDDAGERMGRSWKTGRDEDARPWACEIMEDGAYQQDLQLVNNAGGRVVLEPLKEMALVGSDEGLARL